MNKYFKLAKLSVSMSLVPTIVGSAMYIGFIARNASGLQYLNGKEELVDIIFRSHLSELRTAYCLWGMAFIFLLATVYFSYLGYKAEK
jgi:hypothetical protein